MVELVHMMLSSRHNIEAYNSHLKGSNTNFKLKKPPSLHEQDNLISAFNSQTVALKPLINV